MFNRLRFLSVCLLLALQPLHAVTDSVRTVLVVFKTHLDVGFTDLSSVVARRYAQEFIPKAMDVAEQLQAEGGEARYVWTTGSWLIHEYMKKAAPADRARLERHLREGSIVWNAMPYTVESETMTLPHFRACLRLSARYDSLYGKHTVAAKMTDVPGHTRAIVGPLADAGIRLLHIGVNPACPIPGVPPFCRWQMPDGREIMLVYQQDYGTEDLLPDGHTVLSFNFTGDNHGPHTAAKVKEIFARLRAKYPRAVLRAATLNDVVRVLDTCREALPVVTSEIGDTWVFGYGSAPKRMARYRRLAALYGRWVAQQRIVAGSDLDLNFALTLGLVGEHTQGMDVKTHLVDWDKYNTEAFTQARAAGRYRRVERSWAEVDEYIDSAVALLPADLRDEAQMALDSVEHPEWDARKMRRPKAEMAARPFTLDVCGMQIGPLTYQTYSAADYDDFHRRYLRARYGWALADLGKPGLDKSRARSAALDAYVTAERTDKHRGEVCRTYRLAFTKADTALARLLPEALQCAVTTTADGRRAHIALTVMGKPAVRLPEAYWLSFLMPGIRSVVAEKVGTRVNVLDVVPRGNAYMHGIDGYVEVGTDSGTWRITSADAPLMQVGTNRGLAYDTQGPQHPVSVHFNLSNNLWGTNFSMWSEGSLTYHFTIERLR